MRIIRTVTPLLSLLLAGFLFPAHAAPQAKAITFEALGAEAEKILCMIEIKDDATDEILFAPTIQFARGEHATATLAAPDGTVWKATVSVDARATTGYLDLTATRDGKPIFSIKGSTIVK